MPAHLIPYEEEQLLRPMKLPIVLTAVVALSLSIPAQADKAEDAIKYRNK